jgi:short-subunit dehydrogenase
MPARRPVALITGAASGIGAALARVFAANGHELVLVDVQASLLNAVAGDIAGGGRVHPVALPCDLTHPDAIRGIGRELELRGLEPAFVVNAAGFGLVGPAAELDLREQLAMIDLNVRALTGLSVHFLESLARHRGAILNTASVAGFLPGPGMAVYNATKAYVISFSEALHRELEPKGIRVTVVCPGPVPTGFHARARIDQSVLHKRLPKWTVVRAPEWVAARAYRGVMRGERIVVPGFGNKVIAACAGLLPRASLLAGHEGRMKASRIAPGPKSDSLS